MRSLQDEIRQAQQELACPLCGRRFELRDIAMHQFGRSNAELSVSCNRGHFPVFLLVPITLREMSKAGRISRRELSSAYKKIDSLKETLLELLD